MAFLICSSVHSTRILSNAAKSSTPMSWLSRFWFPFVTAMWLLIWSNVLLSSQMMYWFSQFRSMTFRTS